MNAFSPDAVRDFASGWDDFRRAAAERFAAASMPTPDEEIWRYSRIDQLDLDIFKPAVCDTTGGGGADLDDVFVTDVEPELFATRRPTCSPNSTGRSCRRP